MRRLRHVRAVWVLALALGTAACDQAAPPPVAALEPVLEADATEVFKGVLDTVIRPAQMALLGGEGHVGSPRPHFLVVDTTLAMCASDQMARSTPPGGCIGPFWLGFVSQVVPTTVLLFETRNARRLVITGSLGPDVTFISATVTDFVAPETLLGQHPPGSAIVSFSAPVYPGSGTAVVAYRVRHRRAVAAAARLQRRSGGWTLAPEGVRGGIEETRN